MKKSKNVNKRLRSPLKPVHTKRCDCILGGRTRFTRELTITGLIKFAVFCNRNRQIGNIYQV